jgi:uncharacterized membrane protein YdjX (TVP38/TMEM64 family)
VLLLVAGFIALLVLARKLGGQDALRGALDWIRGLGPLGPVIFVPIYVIASVLFLPAFLLTIGAGAIFGVVKGSILVSIASTLGATCAFLVGRYVARSWIAHKIEGDRRFQAIDEAVGREGWKIVGLTRLSPVLPFVLLNYGFGITKVSLRDYVVASWIGMMPVTVMYVYLGSVAGSLAGGERSRTPAEWFLYGLGLIATIAVAVLITRIARRALTHKGVG